MKSDWKEQPDGSVDYTGSHVGLFGAISGEAIVENFILDRIEVKVHTSSTVGIVCGYVDAMIKTVGVYNGIVTLAPGAAVNSGYSLLGEKSEKIKWDDLPWVDSEYADGVGGGDGGGMGGDLVIDPNDYENNGDSEFTAISSGAVSGVPGAVPGTAYFSGALSTASAKISTKKMYDMRAYANGSGHVTFTYNDNSSYTMKKIGAMYEKYRAGDTLIKMDAPFNSEDQIANGTVTVKDRANKDISIPRGCIWFKPLGGGTVSMAFGATDQSSNRYAMLYVCQREGDTLTVVKKIEYQLPKSVVGNGQLVYYEYEITAEDLLYTQM